MIECTVDIINATDSEITIVLPGVAQDAWLVLREKLKKKRINQVYLKMGMPRKPRTTGKRSDNTHVHGHASEIGHEVGETKSKIIMDAVEIAMAKMGREFPTHTDYKGDIVPDGEPEWSTYVAHEVIEALHQIATMIPMKLTEYEESNDRSILD